MRGKYSFILKRTIVFFAIVALPLFNSGNRSKDGSALSFGENRGGDLRYDFPAEFEKHEAVWLSAIDEKYFAGRSRLGPVTEIIKMLKPHVKAKVTVESKEKLNMFKDLVDEIKQPWPGRFVLTQFLHSYFYSKDLIS